MNHYRLLKLKPTQKTHTSPCNSHKNHTTHAKNSHKSLTESQLLKSQRKTHTFVETYATNSAHTNKSISFCSCRLQLHGHFLSSCTGSLIHLLDAHVNTIPKSFKKRLNCDNIHLKKRLNVNSTCGCSVSPPWEKDFRQKSGQKSVNFPRVARPLDPGGDN